MKRDNRHTDSVNSLIDRLPDDPGALDRVMPLIYDELRRVAGRCMSGERLSHTLQTTALVHEAFIKLSSHQAAWRNRVHFFAAAATAMRRILVDHARSRGRQRRGGEAVRITLDVEALGRNDTGTDVLDLHRKLNELARMDERKARAVELFYFAGLEYAEIAEALGISRATAKRDLQFARAWLRAALNDGR